MKTIIFLYFLTLALAFSGCYPKSTESNSRDVIVRWYRHNKFQHKDSIKLSTIIKNDTIFFNYTIKLDTLIGHSFKISSKSDSSLVLFGSNCPLVAKKQFVVEGKTFTINKYYYDVPNLMDEESSFFYNEHYGLLAGLNGGWLSLGFTMEYDPTSKKLIDSILNNKVGFFDSISVPVPPPPKNVDEVIELINVSSM